MFFEALRDGRALRIAYAGARIHDDIDCRQQMLMPTKRLPDQALHSIPTHSVSNESSRHREA